GRRWDVATLSLNGLNKDGGALFRRHDGLEDLVFNKPSALHCILGFGHALRPVIHVRKGNVGHSRNQWEKAAALLHLGSGVGERAHGASMEGAVKCDDALALSVIA